MKSKLHYISCALTLQFLFIGNAVALNFKGGNQVQTLKGLSGVHIVTQGVDNPEDYAQLSQKAMAERITQSLRKVNIQLLSKSQLSNSPGQPVLVVSIDLSSAADTSVYRIDVYLVQSMIVQRNTALVTYIPTWSTGSIGLVSTKSGQVTILKQLDEHIDEFVRAYLSVNKLANPAETSK